MIPVSRETWSVNCLGPFLHHLSSRPPISNWLSDFCPDGEGRLSLKGVHGSLIPFLFYLLHKTVNKPLLSVSESLGFVNRLYNGLLALNPKGAGRLFVNNVPSREDLRTGDLIPIHDLQTFNLFLSRQLPFLLTTTYIFDFMRVVRAGPNKTTLSLQIGKRITYQTVRETLTSWGYERVDAVQMPGCFAIRGGIVDIFPLGFSSPVRIEFIGDEVESFRYFDPLSQRMLQKNDVREIIISPPYYLKQKSEKQRGFVSTIPHDFPIFLIKTCGPKDLYDLIPYAPKQPEKAKGIDLGCLSHVHFRGNTRALSSMVVQLIKKHGVTPFLFFDTFYVDMIKNEKTFQNFKTVPYYFKGSFSSLPLNLFCVSLDKVYPLPKPIQTHRFQEVPDRSAPVRATITDDFDWGAPVVHENFGIGLYRGLTVVGAHGRKHECVSLEFSGGDLVHVPFDRLDQIHAYVGSTNKTPQLSTLGSTKWQRAKQQSRRSAEKVVDDFIHLYAVRHTAEGFRFSPDTELHLALKSSFPFEETADQITTYNKIKEDMELKKPMDRLICGDVGFGKTEIAIRAAFKAVYDKKQVAVLAPTTILANQHYVTFKSRLGDLGVRVSLLTRFTAPREKIETIQRLRDGNIDIIVGTHRLLSKDIHFSTLGLLIIDEEHRFGARHKEQIKKYRIDVDVLTMSATPIPRTLQFSLLGIRDVSTIMTPPKERLPIITRLISFHTDTIQRGVMAEIKRGGQVFFVHDDVKTIHSLTARLQEFFPSLTIGFAHGQLPGRTLEDVMINFLNRAIDVLACTTIIEAGIDLPNVNTIFINNAYRFGLSQIHQMRGRVGRGNRQAYCYLVIPEKKKLTESAQERLRLIEYHSSLGSGYILALKDLEIRGAGNLFGVEQSGHISSVGYHLFCKIVEDVASERLNNKTFPGHRQPAEILFDGSAMIPDFYVPDVADRLHFYRRLSTSVEISDIKDIKNEMRDRFGPVPLPVQNLLHVAGAQVQAQKYGLKKLVLSKRNFSGVFVDAGTPEDLLTLARTIQSKFASLGYPFNFSSPSGGGLEFSVPLKSDSPGEGFKAIEYLFESIQTTPNFY